MKYSYIIIDDDHESSTQTQALLSTFKNLHLVAMASSYELGVDVVLENRPDLIFLEIDPLSEASGLSLQFVTELYRYLAQIPKIIITTKNPNFAFDALRLDVFDYLLKPLSVSELRKTIFKFERHDSGIGKRMELPANPFEIDKNSIKVEHNIDLIEPSKSTRVEDTINNNLSEIKPLGDSGNSSFDENEVPAENRAPIDSSEVAQKSKPLIICVKSYGDYRFIDAAEICYLQADNNSTDIHLINGEMVTAFKTLKHFEILLSSPFVRIHNSYIVNIQYVSRIHTGNSVCYIKNTTTKLPFSKSYKDNVDAIINNITTGNYLEI